MTKKDYIERMLLIAKSKEDKYAPIFSPMQMIEVITTLQEIYEPDPKQEEQNHLNKHAYLNEKEPCQNYYFENGTSCEDLFRKLK